MSKYEDIIKMFDDSIQDIIKYVKDNGLKGKNTYRFNLSKSYLEFEISDCSGVESYDMEYLVIRKDHLYLKSGNNSFYIKDADNYEIVFMNLLENVDL